MIGYAHTLRSLKAPTYCQLMLLPLLLLLTDISPAAGTAAGTSNSFSTGTTVTSADVLPAAATDAGTSNSFSTSIAVTNTGI